MKAIWREAQRQPAPPNPHAQRAPSPFSLRQEQVTCDDTLQRPLSNPLGRAYRKALDAGVWAPPPKPKGLKKPPEPAMKVVGFETPVPDSRP